MKWGTLWGSLTPADTLASATSSWVLIWAGNFVPWSRDPLKRCHCDNCSLWSLTEMPLLFHRTVVGWTTILDASSTCFTDDVSFLARWWRLKVAYWDLGKLEHGCVELEGKSLADFGKITEHPVPGAVFHLCCGLVAGIEPGAFTAHTKSHVCLLIIVLQYVLGP